MSTVSHICTLVLSVGRWDKRYTALRKLGSVLLRNKKLHSSKQENREILYGRTTAFILNTLNPLLLLLVYKYLPHSGCNEKYGVKNTAALLTFIFKSQLNSIFIFELEMEYRVDYSGALTFCRPYLFGGLARFITSAVTSLYNIYITHSPVGAGVCELTLLRRARAVSNMCILYPSIFFYVS